MSRLAARIFIAAIALVADASAQDEVKSRSQHDIIRERAQACRGLKGEAMTECQANYVGPRRDRIERGGWRRPSNPSRGPGRA